MRIHSVPKRRERDSNSQVPCGTPVFETGTLPFGTSLRSRCVDFQTVASALLADTWLILPSPTSLAQGKPFTRLALRSPRRMGAPGENRTRNRQIRNLMLYPVKLRVLLGSIIPRIEAKRNYEVGFSRGTFSESHVAALSTHVFSGFSRKGKCSVKRSRTFF